MWPASTSLAIGKPRLFDLANSRVGDSKNPKCNPGSLAEEALRNCSPNAVLPDPVGPTNRVDDPTVRPPPSILSKLAAPDEHVRELPESSTDGCTSRDSVRG